ncbi:MAG: YolD-like family protein [Bacilli bacterium]
MNRGMKKWLPFSSLVEQQDFLDKMIYEKNKQPRPQISIEQANKIDRILKEYPKNKLTFKFYLDGYLYTFNGVIKRIDTQNKKIYFEDFYLPLKDIIDIEEVDIFDSIN